jgi:predicted homoserine dehydrogenase-like protein
VAPIAGPVCEVLSVAKRDLKASERLDGIGGFCCYGLIDNAASARAINGLPIGLSEGRVLNRDVAKDEVISFDDLDFSDERLSDRLWKEQCERWPQIVPGLHLHSVQSALA